MPIRRYRMKLTLSGTGGIAVRVHPIAVLPTQVRFVVAAERTESTDPLLRHKTTARKLYDNALELLRSQPDVFDALFFNEKGELTEGARTNVFLVTDGVWLTPRIESGVLNGIMRQEVLSTRAVSEQTLYYEDLMNADAVYLSNSLRGLVRASFVNCSP